MAVVETFLGLLLLLGALAWLAPKVHVPYAVLLVAAGVSVAFVPGIPKVALDPDAVFLIFVPPIVFHAAFFSSWFELRRYARAIGWLAVALVLTTMVAVAWVAHALIPGFVWPVAFVLGAIVSPSDATAVISILQELRLPRRLENVLEGESLLNDPVAIVSYQMAIAAVLTGTFSLLDAGARLVGVTAGGIAVGLAIGALLYELRKRLDYPEVEVIASFLGPYAAFLPADRLGVSGVVATLAAGMYLGWRLPRVTDAETRLQTQGAWTILVFLLSGLVFILLGMQLPAVVERLAGRSFAGLAINAALICLVVMGVRVVWVFANICWSCWREGSREILWGELAIAAWSGMRGVDSLVTSLAIPLVVRPGVPFPERDAIIFIAACVIVATLVLQGLTLPALVRIFDVRGDDADEREAAQARYRASQAAIARLRARARETRDEAERQYIERLLHEYDLRLKRSNARMRGAADEDLEALVAAYHEVMQEALDAERHTILMLRNEGLITNDVMHRIERELDLKESLHRND